MKTLLPILLIALSATPGAAAVCNVDECYATVVGTANRAYDDTLNFALVTYGVGVRGADCAYVKTVGADTGGLVACGTTAANAERWATGWYANRLQNDAFFLVNGLLA